MLPRPSETWGAQGSAQTIRFPSHRARLHTSDESCRLVTKWSHTAHDPIVQRSSRRTKYCTKPYGTVHDGSPWTPGSGFDSRWRYQYQPAFMRAFRLPRQTFGHGMIMRSCCFVNHTPPRRVPPSAPPIAREILTSRRLAAGICADAEMPKIPTIGLACASPTTRVVDALRVCH